MNIFRRVQSNGSLLRNSYFFQVDGNLPWSHSIGSEDDTNGSKSIKRDWCTVEKNRETTFHYFRGERHNIRRFSRTSGVVFTIRRYLHPVTEISAEPYVPVRLASALRGWGWGR